MAFQRSYSKVWWGSDNQLPFSTTNHNLGSSLTSGGFYYSLYSSSQSLPPQQQLSEQGQQQSLYQNGNNGYHSLDYNNYKGFIGNLSRIQEVDDENNISKLSWEKHDSPGSLRSQDSGFSDNEESHSTRAASGVTGSPISGRGSSLTAPSSPLALSASQTPSSASQQTIETPPTVVRRVGQSQFYSPLVSVSRRISFSGMPSNFTNQDQENEEEAVNPSDLELMQIFADRKAKRDQESNAGNEDDSMESPKAKESPKKIRRRKRVFRKSTTPLSPTRQRLSKLQQDESDDEEFYKTNDEEEENSSISFNSKKKAANHSIPEYNNETVYLGEAPPPYNNETVIFGGVDTSNLNQSLDTTLKKEEGLPTPLTNSSRFTASTSTPKAKAAQSSKKLRPKYSSSTTEFQFPLVEYENPLLNGHSPSLQNWLQDIRSSYDHEVMSTLQTKSIATEAFKNLTITTHMVTKLIRQLQQRALYMQSDFERIERILSGLQESSLQDALISAEQLVKNVEEFTKVLERRAVFFSETRVDRKKFDQHIEHLRLLAKDINYSLAHQHYISLISLLDDVQVLKSYLLLTVRGVFEKMLRIIVQSIEQSRSDLMLRANINMIATLANIDYEGFASLSEALIENEAIRALLIVCLDHKLSSVRALTLKALSYVCSSQRAIKQLVENDGLEIIREILQVRPASNLNAKKRTDIERLEAVSVLTQITAFWHGPNHKVEGLKDCGESIVEGITDLLTRVKRLDSLLLCVAALNNLSRSEITTHYSIMSNETIFKLMEVVQNLQSEDDCAIFLYEQIVAMLNNMALNKKCHSHLANGSIINFITSIYQNEFYKTFDTRPKCDAQRHTIKTVLHILSRLVHDSSLGMELIEQNHIPEFFKMAISAANSSSNDSTFPLDYNNSSVHSLPSMTSQQYITVRSEMKNEVESKAAISSTNNVTIVKVDPGCSSSGPSSLTDAGALASAPQVASAVKLNLTRQESYV